MIQIFVIHSQIHTGLDKFDSKYLKCYEAHLNYNKTKQKLHDLLKNNIIISIQKREMTRLDRQMEVELVHIFLIFLFFN